jgi:hypothetical protein
MFWGGIYVSQTQNCVYFAGSVWFNGEERRDFNEGERKGGQGRRGILIKYMFGLKRGEGREGEVF